MTVDNIYYLDELHTLISYRFVTPVEEILERICGTPEATSVPEEIGEERETKGK